MNKPVHDLQVWGCHDDLAKASGSFRMFELRRVWNNTRMAVCSWPWAFPRVSLPFLLLERYRTFFVCGIHPIVRSNSRGEHWLCVSSIDTGNYIPISALMFQIESRVRSYNKTVNCRERWVGVRTGCRDSIFLNYLSGDRKQKTSTGASHAPELWGKTPESC